MKKTILWFAACILISSIIFAQNTPTPTPTPTPTTTTTTAQTPTTTAQNKGGINANRIRIGLALGPTFSSLNVLDNTYSNEGARLSFAYGLLLDYGFADRYAISTGIMGVPGGGDYKEVDSTTINLRMRYLQIPLYLKLRTNNFGKFTPFGQVGIAASYALSRRYDQESANVENADAASFSKPINFSVGGGAGVEYALGANTSAFVLLDYQHGFLNVIDNADKISNSNFAIKLGIYF
jgi:hypothetical protein